MRSSRKRAAVELALALTVGGLAIAGCAPKDAPVCQPVFSMTTPAYGCGGTSAAPPIVLEEPPPPELAPELPPAPVLATLGATSIDLAEKIRFETGSPVILPASEPLLDQVAQLIVDHPELTRLRIAGYTDSVGSNARNKALSQARADAVRSYLENHGVAATRLEAKGFGETNPVADNRTPDGREQNRRVEITILRRGP